MSIKIQPKNPQQVGTPSSTDPKMSGEVTIMQNDTHENQTRAPVSHLQVIFH